jgi:hypothetical protein
MSISFPTKGTSIRHLDFPANDKFAQQLFDDKRTVWDNYLTFNAGDVGLQFWLFNKNKAPPSASFKEAAENQAGQSLTVSSTHTPLTHRPYISRHERDATAWTRYS